MADSRDMIGAHNAFRREFAAIPALVRGIKSGDQRVSVICKTSFRSVTLRHPTWAGMMTRTVLMHRAASTFTLPGGLS